MTRPLYEDQDENGVYDEDYDELPYGWEKESEELSYGWHKWQLELYAAELDQFRNYKNERDED